MNMSDAGLALTKRFEGFSASAYSDPGTGAEPWTIGYGHTGGVRPGDTCTEDQATAWLRSDIAHAEDAVTVLVETAITQNQFDALVDFVFNVGAGNFRTSTLRKKLNASDYGGAADQFLAWDMAGGHHLPGLAARRAAERELFLS